MTYFVRLEGESAVVRKSGGFRQVDLYAYGNKLFFKYGSDFVRVDTDGRTSKPDIFVQELPNAIETKVGDFGHLQIVKVN